MHSLRFLPLVVVLLSALLPSWGQQMPQDNWIYEGKRVLGTFRCLHIAKDNLIYVGSTNVIAVYDTQLNFVRQFGTVGTVKGIASDSLTNIYVIETSAVKVYNPISGASVRQWGSAGTSDGQFSVADNSSPGAPVTCAISIDSADEVYVADSGNRRIQVFTTNGTFVRKWGPSTPGQTAPFTDAMAVGAMPNGRVATIHYSGSFENTAQFFLKDGTFVKGVSTFVGNIGPAQIAVSPDNLAAVGYPVISDSTAFAMFNPSSTAQFTFEPFSGSQIRTALGFIPGNGFIRSDGIGFSSEGDVFLVAVGPGALSKALFRLTRSYANGRKLPLNSTPQPQLVSVSQRQLSSFVDIDYLVRDSDSAAVQVALLGFTNGLNTLSGLIRMTNFVEGTITNLGTGIPANSTRRTTWDPATDWNVGFGNIQFEVLAKDERGMFPFHFITVPTNGVNPSIKVSDRPVSDPELLSVWFWLVATSDPAVQFTANKEVNGTVADALVVYASGTTTTAAGKTYLFNRLGVRAITAGEVTQANSGRFGFPATVTTSHVVKLP